MKIARLQFRYTMETRNIEHVYHEGWDCICSVKEFPSGFFKSFVHCKSLMHGELKKLPDISELHDIHDRALQHARKVAMMWSKDNKHLPQK